MQVLLRNKDINPDLVNKVHRTPLSHAAENGHVGVVKLLLANSNGRVNPDACDSNLRTPCYRQVRREPRIRLRRIHRRSLFDL